MNIVQPAPGDIGIREAAALAGCCDRTLRRAIRAGYLPERYVLGQRGLTLVFARDEVRRWRAGRRSRPYRRAIPAEASGTRPAMLESLAGMRESLGAARTALDRFSHRGRRSAAAARTHRVIEVLEGRLAEIESALAASFLAEAVSGE